MQHIKSDRQGRKPFRRSSRRIGADAAFAKAMARSEFGRFYTDDKEQREVRRSLSRAKAQREPRRQPEKADGDSRVPAKVTGKTRSAPWREPKPGNRRTELAEARARLKASARSRAETEEA